MKKSIFLLFLIPFVFSCTDAEKAALSARGQNHKIELLSCDGSVVREWYSEGVVMTDTAGYYFQDHKTKNLVNITGTIVISVVDKIPE